jgi:hypothetical protein
LLARIEPFRVEEARDIFYLEQYTPKRRVTRQTIYANEAIWRFTVVIPSPYVTAVASRGGCYVDDVVNSHVDSRFNLELEHSVGIGRHATYAYEAMYDFPEGHVTRECRGFAPLGMNKGQIVVAFDPTTPPKRVYATTWAGPSDGTINPGESTLRPGPLEVFDRENRTTKMLPFAVLVDMPVLPGTAFGVRWEWPD